MRAFLMTLAILCYSSCSGFAWSDESGAGQLHLSFEGQPVLSYCYGDQLAPGVPEKFRRSSYIHPIYGLDGEVLTEDFPADHYHHRGLSLMWPVMKVGDMACDLWTLDKIRSVFRKWSYQGVSPGMAEVGIHNAWVMSDGREVADEVLHLRVYAATDLGRVIDVRYVLTARGEPISLHGQTAQNKGYGGLVFRVPHNSLRKDTVISTNAGLLAADSLREPFEWADLSARMPGGTGVSGIAVIPVPTHPNYPPGWMLRHYGVLNPAWPGTTEFVMQPGEPLELGYRIYVHRGVAIPGRIAKVREEWQAPR
jgi:hypothetical protein